MKTKLIISTAIVLTLVASACGTEVTKPQVDTTSSTISLSEEIRVDENGNSYVVPLGGGEAPAPRTTTTQAQVEQIHGTPPVDLDPRLIPLWERYGAGPEGCNPSASNWSKDACYQYTIGAGTPDPPSGRVLAWPINDTEAYRVKEGSCAHWRNDPTWVDEGLNPYFARPTRGHTFIPVRDATTQTLPYALEWASYLGAIGVVQYSVALDNADENPSWESCLLLSSTQGCCRQSLADQDQDIALIARDVSSETYSLGTDERGSEYNLFVDAVTTSGDVHVFKCIAGHTNRAESGYYSRETGLRSRIERDYIEANAVLYYVAYYDGRMRVLGGVSLLHQGLEPTGSCEGDIALLQHLSNERQQTVGGTWHDVRKWYTIPVEVAEEIRVGGRYDGFAAVSCFVGKELKDIYLVNRDYFKSCQEITDSGLFTQTLNLAPQGSLTFNE